jgi:hypothetical protein
MELRNLIDEVYTNNFTSSQDFNKHSRFNSRIKVPTYGTAPAVCEVGELYVNSGTGKAYVCSSANTWSLIGTQS